MNPPPLPPLPAGVTTPGRFLFPTTNSAGQRVVVLMERPAHAKFHGDEAWRALELFIKQFPPAPEQLAQASEGDARLARWEQQQRLAKAKEQKR